MTTGTTQEARAITLAVFACREADTPMPFALYREQDVTGAGTVAHGVRFPDGTVVIRSLGENPSTVLGDSLEAAMRVCGHDGRTQVVWLLAPFSEMGLAEQEAAAAERERIRQLAIRNNAVCAGDEGTYCYFADLIREPS